MPRPTNDKSNVMSANVSNLQGELQRLAATGKPDGRDRRRELPAYDARTMVIHGK